jgi:hypothetical protein
MIPDEAGGKLSYGMLSISFPDASSKQKVDYERKAELSQA